MLKPKTRWKIKSCNKSKIETLASNLSISPLVAELLVNRISDNEEDIRSFLNKEQQFYDPFLIDQMEIAIERVNLAIEKNEKILVFGDYDADGVTSTTVMLKALKKKGAANVDFYIPNRFTEGYGPNEGAFRWAKEMGYTLIITVDTGISAVHESFIAKDLGLDLIITDHHEPPPELPVAYAIIHPRKPGSHYPFGELAGVGVALKFAQALIGDVPTELLQFAAIGTVADLVPLHSENRLIVHLGLRELKNTKNIGLQELFNVSGIDSQSITEETIGFTIGPRINAVGRLGSADPAVQLLMTEERGEANELAQEIETINQKRQAVVQDITQEAMDEVENNYPPEENGVIVIAREGWNPGVIGIVASRLVEKYYRPTIVLSINHEKGEAKGSARSIAGFDLYANLSTCRDILPHFGGHPMAAGMTLNIEDVPSLRDRLNKLALEKLTKEDFTPITEIDLISSMENVNLDTIEEIGQLAPFGVGNPKPLVMLKDVPFSQIRRIGSDGSHLKITLEKDGSSLDGIGFGHGDLIDEISPISELSLIGELSINEWNGFRKPQFMIKDVSVDSWQLFDLRSSRNIAKHLSSMTEKTVTIAFQKDTINTHGLSEWENSIISIDVDKDIQETSELDLQGKSLVILDLPNDKSHLEYIIKQSFPERIYCFFAHKEEHFFSTIPTREHFKWFYAFLLKQKQIDLKKHAHVIAKKKGWSKETVDFISKVFFELEFVTIDDGIIKLVDKPAKRDIEESSIYKKKQNQLELEQEFLYSSYETLKKWFETIYQGSFKYEEEKVR